MKKDYEQEILLTLYRASALTKPKLLSAMKIAPKNCKAVGKIIERLCDTGFVRNTKGYYSLKNRNTIFMGTVTRIPSSFGFVSDEETGEELFVRGRSLMGAVPGDIVLAKRVPDEKPDPNGNPRDMAIVLAIAAEGNNVLTGTVVEDGKELKLVPASFMAREALTIKSYRGHEIHAGDKVRFALHSRGEGHSDHTVDITGVYGSGEFAKSSVDAYLEEKDVATEFPDEVIDEAKAIQSKGISENEKSYRLDLRHLPIFTIDGADTKDIDDAISISRSGKGYDVGVHIADVSYYVTKNSPLDKEAFERGNSYYIADRVIPMLPKELSNGICSLNPKEERLAFSCLMKLSEGGELLDFEFKKTVIRSRVQGVYSEVNKILDGTADDEIKEKYAEVLDEIPLMNELAAILKKNRELRGAPALESPETKIVCDEDGVCVDVKKRVSGVSEGIIEELMLIANNSAAKLAMHEEFPFVYRVHEPPTAEKLTQLADSLNILGVDAKAIGEKSTSADLAELLKKTREDPRSEVINRMVLRTMMKAQYSELPKGHYGLVMKEYAHFTSPIRRYADLSIHRILSDYVSGEKADKLAKKYLKFAQKSSIQTSNTELKSVSAERDCNKFYMAELMKKHLGETFDGIVSGVMGSGIFVELPNTVEGRISTLSLPDGVYDVENNVALVEQASGIRFTVGDKITVKCVAANVSSGLIDFEPTGAGNKAEE